MNDVPAAARAEGRTVLLEVEALQLAAELGLDVPRHVVAPDASAVRDGAVALPPGARVVVKAQSPELLHKTEHGAVAVVPADRERVADCIAALQDRLAGYDLRGFLIAEFVTHDARLGDELLVGMRWTTEFGAVVTVGAGGIDAEFVAASAHPGTASAIVSPQLAEAADLEAALAGCAVTRLLTTGQRGQPPRLPAQRLTALLRTIATCAERWLPQELIELEFNPVARTADGRLVALDALARLGDGRRPRPIPRPTDKLARLLRPASIAVIGASQQRNPGRIILDNVLDAGFPREHVFVIKPQLDELAGCRCVPELAALPAAVDLLVVAVDAAQVPRVVQEVIAGRHAETLILIPGGLGESAGSAGRVAAMQDALAAARRTPWRGPLLNGGNCLGVRSAPGRFDTLFIPEVRLGARDGRDVPLALLAQSGAFAIARQSAIATLAPRYVVTVGNQIDLTLGDYLDHLLDSDPDLAVYACYVEGFRPLDGLQFVQAARRATRTGRPVIVYRAGRTAAGAGAAASHTASIAGDHAVTRALCETAGVLLADSLDDFDDLVRIAVALADKEVRGPRVGAVSNAGFECVALADNLQTLELTPFTTATRSGLQQVLETAGIADFVDVHNPLDLTPIAGDATYENAVRTVLEDAAVDAALVGVVPMTPALQTLPAALEPEADATAPEAVASRLCRVAHDNAKPLVAVVDAGPRYDVMARHLEAGGVPTFRRADRAARILARYVTWRLRHPAP